MKTQLDELNEFLIKLATADKVGIRRKIVALEQYIKKIKGEKNATRTTKN